ncbi:transcription elongation factor SPT5-like isoform X2 [Planococcus citri]|uniref:transcription elongation factor SPT5-like isoform X2 n=1 Tax=Planococcus citri TaxID=170843 RepID=UPI0031FA25F7
MSSDEEYNSGSEAEENNTQESVSDEEEPEGEVLNSEDDYDDEDEERDNARYKKRRNERHGGFILEEAEVDDEVESEDEYDDEQEIGVVANEIDEVGPTAQEIEGRRRGTTFWDSQKEDEIEEYLRRKYAGESMSAKHFGDGGEDMSDEITQQTLLPGVKDPNLWMVKCRMGEEKNTCLQLMRKFIAYMLTEEPLQIKSVVAPEGAKGYIYIEAYKQAHVKQAIDRIGSLRMGVWKQQMVPIKEMTDILRVAREKVGLKPRQWVRIKRGLYKDDIAQVDYVDIAQNRVSLKLLPRIDYTIPSKALRAVQDIDDTLKRKKKKRPAAKPFDPEALRELGHEVGTDGDFKSFKNKRYSSKGFLYDNFKMDNILVDGVKPTLSELEKFEEAPEGVDIELPTANKDESAGQIFSAGDNVEVCQGELIHLQGKILSIDGSFITVMPKHNELKTPLEFQACELKKHFKMGDHVRVISGRNEGDTGLVIRAEDNRTVVCSDLTMHELEILPRDLQLCTDMATGVDSLGQFQHGDLVQIDPQTVGVIVRLEKEIFHVLNMHGKVVEVRPQALHKRKEYKNTLALDSDQQTIQRKDIVKVIDGPHSGRGGEIKHLYRNFAFLFSKMFLDNSGIFVCKTRHLQLAGGGRDASTISLDFAMSPRISSPAHPSGGSGGRGRGRGGFTMRDREIIGKTIKITRGPYKGNIGIVKDSTDTTSRVELHTSCQTISVDRNNIQIVGEPNKDGSYSSYSRTPACVGQTPMYAGGSRTPMHGSQTPLYDSSGNRTPRHYGSMTPVHDGSRTPALWEGSVSNTPARQSEPEEENWDTCFNNSPSNNYAPQTPASNYASSDNSFSPYHTNSPSAYHGSSASSSSYMHTPSPGGSAFGKYSTTSPISYSPMTPGSSSSVQSPYDNPGTPGSEMTSLQESFTPGVFVRVLDSFDDRGLVGQTGVIRRIKDGMCTLFIEDEGQDFNIPCDCLEPVAPRINDWVKVLLGDESGMTGKLLSIDGQDGVVQFKDETNPKLIQARVLCRYQQD